MTRRKAGGVTWILLIRKRRVLALMLGDTSMGMINGYFGPRLLNRHGFTEHKIDQAWIIDRDQRNSLHQLIDYLTSRKTSTTIAPSSTEASLC